MKKVLPYAATYWGVVLVFLVGTRIWNGATQQTRPPALDYLSLLLTWTLIFCAGSMLRLGVRWVRRAEESTP